MEDYQGEMENFYNQLPKHEQTTAYLNFIYGAGGAALAGAGAYIAATNEFWPGLVVAGAGGYLAVASAKSAIEFRWMSARHREKSGTYRQSSADSPESSEKS